VTLAVFDIDGVVADVRHRLHHLERRPKDWGAFFGAAEADVALTAGVVLVHAALANGHEVTWLTGRPSWLRSVTQQWLEDLQLPTGELLMRPHSDFRPARTFKVEALKRLSGRDIVLFVDDDPDVVESARAAGFPAHLATWVPHSKTLARAQEQDGRT
jgi:phosphoglycolate phosphatase-like HAD superfamily hydrolase